MSGRRRPYRGPILILLLVGVVALARAQGPQSPPYKPGKPIAIVGGLLIDATGAAPRWDQTVVIEGDRISAIGAMDQVKPDALVYTVGSGVASLPWRVRSRKPEDGGVVPIVAVLRSGVPRVTPEGANAHVTEPLDPWELCRMISTLLMTG